MFVGTSQRLAVAFNERLLVLLKAMGFPGRICRLSLAVKVSPYSYLCVYFFDKTLQPAADVVQCLCREQKLTERKKEVVRLLFEELTTKEIAHQLNLSERTAKDHRRHLLGKTGSKNIGGLIKYSL